MNTFIRSISVFSLVCASALGTIGCSSSTTPGTTTQVEMTAEVDGSKATAAFLKKTNTLGAGIVADSIEVTRIRYLLSTIKLHVEGNDTTHDGEIKAGPFVLEFTPGLSRVFTTITLPAAQYEKIKFEIHKFPSSIDQTYLNDPTFTDFVTNSRSTVIVEGRVWSAGAPTPINFVYKSNITANVEAKFPGLITLDANTNATIALVFSPMLAFKAVSVLDPRDPDNAKVIDEYLKTAIKGLKK